MHNPWATSVGPGRTQKSRAIISGRRSRATPADAARIDCLLISASRPHRRPTDVISDPRRSCGACAMPDQRQNGRARLQGTIHVVLTRPSRQSACVDTAVTN